MNLDTGAVKAPSGAVALGQLPNAVRLPLGGAFAGAGRRVIVLPVRYLNGVRAEFSPLRPEGDIDTPLPAAWLTRPLPASYIGAGLAQLAMLRGEPFAFDAATGRGLIGGRVLVGMAGGVFVFASPESAAMWASIALARASRELALSASLPAASAAIWKAGRKAILTRRATALLRNAEKAASDRVGALLAESLWCAEKWGESA